MLPRLTNDAHFFKIYSTKPSIIANNEKIMKDDIKILKHINFIIPFIVLILLPFQSDAQENISNKTERNSYAENYDIAQVIKAASEGSIVKIPSGVHRLKSTLTIEKNITLTSENSDDSTEQTVIECFDENSIVLSSEDIRLKNLQIRFETTIDVLPQEDLIGIKIVKGNVFFDNCFLDGEKRIRTPALSGGRIGIHVSGKSSRLTMKETHITRLDTGVMILDGSEGSFIDCLFQYNENAFSVVNKGKLECDRIIVDSNYNGGSIVNDSKCVVLNSCFTKNFDKSLMFSAAGDASGGECFIKNSRFSRSDIGVFVKKVKTCLIEGCEFYNHYTFGIVAGATGFQIRNCKFLMNQYGISIANKSRLDMTQCVFDQGQYGIDVMDSNLSVSKNEFLDLGNAITVIDSVIIEKDNFFKNNINDFVKIIDD